MVRKAQREYGTALQAVNAAIADPLRCLQDETLVSILLLNVLDDLAGHSSFISCSHLEGCTQLIKLREAKDFRTEYSSDLAHSIVLQTQPAILEGWRAEGSFFNEYLINEWLWGQTRPSPAVEVSSFCLQISQLGKMTQDALSRDETDIEGCTLLLIALLENGMNLETSMAQWYKCQDGRWARKTCTLAINDSALLDYYSDIQVAKTWNHWRVARILLHDLLLRSMAHIQASACEYKENLDVLRSNSLVIIERMLLGILASIPYHLQQIDEMGRCATQSRQRLLGGRALMWPLKMVLKSQWSTPAYQQEAMKALQFIGDVVGVKQAAVYLKEAIQPCEPEQ
ncbi:hypothetical protein NQ176_g7729 [Zarea fungicola]|uniref:Uncharacterized protein n=1 Tax=Zarea fungicola TaxID=93591 RepID=A0ACC1MWG8_9HYPO|nr:hypothetical protein NQ176_g7729 [Lecanicillium fungicola]